MALITTVEGEVEQESEEFRQRRGIAVYNWLEQAPRSLEAVDRKDVITVSLQHMGRPILGTPDPFATLRLAYIQD